MSDRISSCSNVGCEESNGDDEHLYNHSNDIIIINIITIINDGIDIVDWNISDHSDDVLAGMPVLVAPTAKGKLYGRIARTGKTINYLYDRALFGCIDGRRGSSMGSWQQVDEGYEWAGGSCETAPDKASSLRD